jgi:hypothetical protein
MTRAAFALTAAAMLAACATSVRSRDVEPTLTETINAQLTKAQAFAWAVKRPLVWADFRGEPPAGGPAAAETAYALFYGARCTGSLFEFRVVAAFRPSDSWVRPMVLKSPTDNARALRHEQTHFDLTEVHARRMRRYFAELMAPCRVSAGELEAMAERLVRDEKAAQAQYDAETDHGRTAAQQTRWNKEVGDQLLTLSRFAK